MNKDEFGLRIEGEYERLLAFCTSLTKNKEDAMDLCQDACLRALENLDKYVEDNFYAWMCTIAKNLFLNKLQKKHAEEIYGIDMQCFTDKELMPNDYFDISYDYIVSVAKTVLPAKLLVVWEMRQAGSGNKDIALELGIPEGTVKSRFCEANKILRKELE